MGGSPAVPSVAQMARPLAASRWVSTAVPLGKASPAESTLVVVMAENEAVAVELTEE